ncbi:DUF1566 domain-containing protein [Ideonella sp. DXS29W]|uniref:DUF1566 domain-containing protein n=1 Tax=Ideonella lacteola TaxID=2984193 RepID=A0ABU9BT34_9BURK
MKRFLDLRQGSLPAWRHWPWLALAVCAPSMAATGKSMLNDTGVTQCVVWDAVQSNYVFTDACAGTGQDGEFGRDAQLRANGNGHAGFVFEKIGAAGEVLPRSAAQWSCVRDKVTGAMWEVKTADGSLRDGTRRFTNQGNGRSDDASGYVAAVNATGLCGATDWRLPTYRELHSLVDYSVAPGRPMLDEAWFPNSAADYHWSSSSAAVNSGGGIYWWALGQGAGDSIWYGGEYGEFAVRLVRLGKAVPADRWVLKGAEVKDKSTGLIWRRCAEGQSWTGSTCTGTPTTFLTSFDAAEHAVAQAAASGKGWRMPNPKELASLVDTRVKAPSIDTVAFPGFYTESYHTGTHWTENEVYDWGVSFAAGQVGRDFWGGKVLLVRDAD